MLSFQEIDRAKMMKIAGFFKYQDFRTCDYTIGGIYMWKDYFQTKYAVEDEMLFMTSVFPDGRLYFSLPIGSGSFEKAMHKLRQYARQNHDALRFCAVTQKGVEMIRRTCEGEIETKWLRDWSDYLYTSDSLAYLKGRKYSGQRNHINKFRRLYPDYQYVRMDENNSRRVALFFSQYMAQYHKENSYADIENQQTAEMIANFKYFNLLGGFLEVHGEIVAFSIGEIVNDTLFVHIEKALRQYEGAYAMINMEFAKDNCTEGILYINREEDLGDEGLRTSKLSYHPYELIDKYLVYIKE